MYKVGDKVVILDVDNIAHASLAGFENGIEYEVVKIQENDSPVLGHNETDRELYFYDRELKYIKKVEKVGGMEMNKKMTLEVGDKLVYIGGENINGGTYTDGQEYEVVSVAGTSGCVTNNNNAHVWWDDFALNHNFKKVEETMYKKGDKLLRTGGSNQFYKQGKTYEVLYCNGERVTLENEAGKGSGRLEDVNKYFALVIDDSVYPYNTGEEIVFADVSKIDGIKKGDLTVGKVYEVILWREAFGTSVEHFIIKDNHNKELIIRYDEYRYVKKVSELECKTYIYVANSTDNFTQGEEYKGYKIKSVFIMKGNEEYVAYNYDVVDQHFRNKDQHFRNKDQHFKYKVGDRFIRTGESGGLFKKGKIYTVSHASENSVRFNGEVGVSSRYTHSMLDDMEFFMPVTESSEYDELVNELDRKEKEIAELKHIIKMLQPLPVMDANQERVIVIHRAKKFISEHLNEDVFDYDMIHTESRRMVTVLLKQKGSKLIHSKGQSICAKGDVFNLYIGRAIALGRALGIDVSYFENAVQPELAIGQIVKTKNAYAKKWQTSKVVSREQYQKEGKQLADDEQFLYYLFGYDMTTSEKKVGIIEDTDAKY